MPCRRLCHDLLTTTATHARSLVLPAPSESFRGDIVLAEGMQAVLR